MAHQARFNSATAALAAAMVSMCAVAAAEPAPPRGPIVADPVDVRGDKQQPAGVDALDSDEAVAADADRALDEPAFVTVVHVDDRNGETTGVADVLAKSVGVNVRTLGGLGAFASISIRGSSPSQTAITIDGVPLSRIASATADIGGFDLTSFSEIEVFRGGVPMELGGAAIGGAVNFVTAVGRDPAGYRGRLSAGVGSFGARHLRGRFGDENQRNTLRYHASVGYQGAAGDYSYFNDNGTPLNRADDAVEARTNNGFDTVDAVTRVDYQPSGLRVRAGGRTLWKQQGIPGVGSVQTVQASLDTFSQLVDVDVERTGAFGSPQLLVGGAAYAFLESQRFRDRLGEVGLATQDQRHRTVAGGASGRAAYALGDHQLITVGLEGRADVYRRTDLADDDDARIDGRRWAGGLAAADEIDLAAGRLLIIGALRLDATRTDPGTGWNPQVIDPDELGVHTEAHPSPRVGVRARITPAVSLKSSVGRYFRAPTVIELFGDRGFVVGNPSLRAETGVSGDVGVVVAPLRSLGVLDRVYVQGAVFASRPRDTISLTPTAGLVAIPDNIGAATIIGAEAAATLRIGRRVTVTANHTFIDSRQDSPMVSFDGKKLPLRPTQEAFARVDVAQRFAGRLIALWSDVTYTSGNFLDAANTSEVPARLFLGAGLKVSPIRGLLVAFEADNLTDERVETIELSPAPRPDLMTIPRPVADFLGYPLPGRSFYVTLDWGF